MLFHPVFKQIHVIWIDVNIKHLANWSELLNVRIFKIRINNNNFHTKCILNLGKKMYPTHTQKSDMAL